MSKITISRNCLNGEHVFIPANTYIDGREHMVINWVCQHCLYIINEKEWSAHVEKHFMPKEPLVGEEQKEMNLNLGNGKLVEIKPGPGITLTPPVEPKLPYPGRKRGPKPKQMDIPGTSK